jgi:hypothetical protein
VAASGRKIIQLLAQPIKDEVYVGLIGRVKNL